MVNPLGHQALPSDNSITKAVLMEQKEQKFITNNLEQKDEKISNFVKCR